MARDLSNRQGAVRKVKENMSAIDPITAEVIGGFLVAVAEEMGSPDEV